VTRGNTKQRYAVFDQFETDIAAIEEKEFYPALERAAGFGRKPQMHLQADQRAVARIVDAAQAQFPGCQHEMAAVDLLAVIAMHIPSGTVRRRRLHCHVAFQSCAGLSRAAQHRIVEPIAR